LRKNFAQQTKTEEEAYLEIAKKLMKLSDSLNELETCMVTLLAKKYNVTLSNSTTKEAGAKSSKLVEGEAEDEAVTAVVADVATKGEVAADGKA
jgi:hypothetical protein